MNDDCLKAREKILHLTCEHTNWRKSCLNMIAAECVASPSVRRVLASDISNRYSSSGVYGGSRYVDELTANTEQLARNLFSAEYAEVRPTTGNIAVLAVLLGLTQPGDTVVTTSPPDGGYPLRLSDKCNIKVECFPFNFRDMEVDLEASIEMIHRLRPRLVMCGASDFLFPYPVKELAQAAHGVGAVLAYDGCHVFGLLAGKQFQNPLTEGADVLIGCTHKTFPGPSGGLILSNDGDLMRRISDTLSAPPMLLSCVHRARIAALGIVLAEMAEYGEAFAIQIAANSQALAASMHERGVPVMCAHTGFTRSHQVVLENGGICSPRGWEIKDRLEECNIIVDAVVRFGTQEVTRLGMKEDEMRHIGALVAEAIHESGSARDVRELVGALTSEFTTLHYSVDEGMPAYSFAEPERVHV